MKRKVTGSKILAVIALIVSVSCLSVGCGGLPSRDKAETLSEEKQASDEETTNDELTDNDATADSTEETENALDVKEEVEAPDPSIMTESELQTVQVEATQTDGAGNTESEIAPENDAQQIVFLGDSIFDSVRDNTGIASLVGKELEDDVYNLAIGGTSAGLRSDNTINFDAWTEPNLMGVVYSITGKVNSSILNGYKSGEVFKSCDFSKTNYFIIEYGTNDFLSYIPLGAVDYKGQYYFYFRTSLDMAINTLQENFPNANIIICTPYYEEFWSADRSRYIGDIHSVNNGFGTLLDYISVLEDVARDHNLYCLNMYERLGIDINNVSDMTVDGIHPSEATRRKYADILATTIRGLDDGTLHNRTWIEEKEKRLYEEQMANSGTVSMATPSDTANDTTTN